jgi:signal transduction histidine kinase
MITFFDKLKLYIYIKWGILVFAALLYGIELFINVVSLSTATILFSFIFVAAIVNVLLHLVDSNNNKLGNIFVVSFSIFAISLDLLLIIISLYLNGGLENSWLFFPAILIFFTGYIFGMYVSLAFSAAAFLGIFLMFLLEYFGVIPHFTIYGIPDFYRSYFSLCVDYLIGMFLLYGSSAISGGYVAKTIDQTLMQLEKSLVSARNSQKESEASRKALVKVMEDLGKAKGELELRVRERTAELEEIKRDLEKRVEERTGELEKAKKATLHMLKNLKDDMVKIQAIDRMKTEFLSMVSHELHTPITPIKGYLALMLGGKMGELPPKLVPPLKILAKQADHLHSLIDSLLDLSRLELGKTIPTLKEPVNIKAVIEDITDAMKVQADEKGITLKVNTPEQLPTILGDAVKLKRVVTNLIGNAIKFTPKAGIIKLNAFIQGSDIRVEVIDNGIGIATDNLERVFHKFFQVDSSYTRVAAGIGMGLPLARELVEIHGGHLWAESKGLGKGSRFIFTLPIVQQ